MAYVLFLLLFGLFGLFARVALVLPEDEDKDSLMTIAIALTHMMGPTVFNNVYDTIFKGFVQIFVCSIVGFLLVAKHEELKAWKHRGYAVVPQDSQGLSD
jgi:hypothetical protein